MTNMGGMVNFGRCKASLCASHSKFDANMDELRTQFQARSGQGKLTIVRRTHADKMLLDYCASQGPPKLKRRKLLEHARGELCGYFASWRGIIEWLARHPAWFCTKRVAGSGAAVDTHQDLALLGTDGQRYYDHATSSDAYIMAVKEERTRRVHLTAAGEPWLVYTFIIFEDAAAEDDGV